jgi:hypothetical protein
MITVQFIKSGNPRYGSAVAIRASGLKITASPLESPWHLGTAEDIDPSPLSKPSAPGKPLKRSS